MKLWEAMKAIGGVYLTARMIAGSLDLARRFGYSQALAEMEREPKLEGNGAAGEPVVVDVMGTEYVLKLVKKDEK